ncbi:uncharacterized protein LOC116768704 [Danaus plexippus]|uniref:uncharacterized protein LOC116768704 n=1 Tax=Danaus plexippus TaxID=13037 RepID=UPI002AAFF419|nr:uncharacterized protein LOC116768704 [Danaus plexippus]
MKIVSFCYFSIFFFIISADKSKKDFKNFGPFELPMIKYEMCKGPKKSNLTSLSSSMTLDEKGEWIFSFNMTILEEIMVDQIKIVIFSLKKNKTNLLYAYKLNEPCKHFLFSSIIQTQFNAVNCRISKDSYILRLNLNEILRSFLGTSFFYGDYLFKTHITTKTGNLFCTETFMRFSKKGKTAVASSKPA